MNIYIVRHAEPDYSIDSLTEKGWREAALLGKRLEKITPAYYYVSPLGRAKDTASFTLRAVGASAEEMDWLREFDHGYRVMQRGTPPALHGTFFPQTGRRSRSTMTRSAGRTARCTGIPPSTPLLTPLETVSTRFWRSTATSATGGCTARSAPTMTT